MSDFFPNFLRAAVTNMMNVMLMVTLIQPKYNKFISIIGGAVAILTVTAVDCFCYFIKDLNMLTSMEMILLPVICLAIKPLFKDNFMQWLYSFITMLNANMMIVVLSYYLSRPFRFPIYANTFIRFILFTGIIILFHYVIRPLYRQSVDHWNIYFYVALCIFIFFAYYIALSGDVITILNDQKIPLLLLCLLTVSIYTSMFHSLKLISREYQLENENIRMKADQNLLQIGTQSLNERMKLMDGYVQELNIQKHDQRHFNATILELIEGDNKEKAIEYLKSSLNYVMKKPKNYCQNSMLNAIFSYYISLAEQNGIICETKLNIPEEISIDPLELSMVIANLLENAIHATMKAAQHRISITAVFTGQLLIQVINPYSENVEFDESGHPVSKIINHGIGTKSVIAFCEKTGAEIVYTADKNTFTVRLIL